MFFGHAVKRIKAQSIAKNTINSLHLSLRDLHDLILPEYKDWLRSSLEYKQPGLEFEVFELKEVQF